MNKLPELNWIAYAREQLGIHEKTHVYKLAQWLKDLKAPSYINTSLPWCGLFIARCLRSAGISYPIHWYRALDYKNYGYKLNAPCYGCVAIKSRKGGGHVTFVVGKTKDGLLVCLGGNQSDQVKLSLYSIDSFDQFRWYGKTSSPNLERYNLPVLDKSNLTKEIKED